MVLGWKVICGSPSIFSVLRSSFVYKKSPCTTPSIPSLENSARATLNLAPKSPLRSLSISALIKDENVSLQKQVELNDSLDWMQRIMETLPEQQRMVIQLRDVEQYDFDEIAEMLEMKPTAVRVALSRARKAVREELIKKHNYGVS